MTEKRKESWQLLRMLKPEPSLPWLFVGDFNEILNLEEKYGEASRLYSQMDRFRMALEDCEFNDLGFIGSKFTWSNKREGGSFTKERLDRAFGNGLLPSFYNNCEVHILPALTLDHSPLLILCENFDDAAHKAQKLFRYEASWSTKQECRSIVENAWLLPGNNSSSVSFFKDGLDRCREKLQF